MHACLIRLAVVVVLVSTHSMIVIRLYICLHARRPPLINILYYNQAAAGRLGNKMGDTDTSDTVKKAAAAVVMWRRVRREAASAAVATVAFHPVDTIKVRMQLGQGRPNIRFQVVTNMLRYEGIPSFYQGLSTGLLRQVTCTAVKSYSFRSLLFTSSSKAHDGGQKIGGPPRNFYPSLTADAIGAFVCSPAELALTRMQGDATLPAALRRNYKGFLHALHHAASDEGILALWRGAGPCVLRTMGLNMGLLASFNYLGIFMRQVNGTKETKILVGSLLYGVVPPACSKPFDYVKTQLQMMQPDAKGRYPYAGPLDCAIKTLKFGGPLQFYAGFVAYCFTFFPHALLASVLSQRLFQGLKVTLRM